MRTHAECYGMATSALRDYRAPDEMTVMAAKGQRATLQALLEMNVPPASGGPTPFQDCRLSLKSPLHSSVVTRPKARFFGKKATFQGALDAETVIAFYGEDQI